MPSPGKLTRAEVELAVQKICQKYDEYASRFFKSPQLKGAFEERYFDAVRHGLDLKTFLQVEIGVVEEMVSKAEARLQQTTTRRAETREKKGFADRVIDELRAKIEKYEDVPFQRQANPEIRRLVGALIKLDQDHIPRLHDAFRNTSFNYSSREMIDLDGRLRDMGTIHSGVPPRLTRYSGLLSAFPRDYPAIDREEKSFLLEAALLLHDFRRVIGQVLEVYSDLAEPHKIEIAVVDNYLRGVIEDFRLKDFNRSNFKEGG